MKTLVLLAALAPAAFGQFTLTRVDGGAERAVGAVVDLGTAYPAEAKSTRLRVRNISEQAAAVTSVTLSGTGFAVDSLPKLPVGLAPQEAFDFTVVFRATAVASYSAVLEAGGVSAILTAAVLPALTHSVDEAGIAFETVEAGSTATRRVTIANYTAWALPVGVVSVTGEAFALGAAPDGGTVLQPSESAGIEIRFRPPGAGNWTGRLTLGERSYPLSGAAIGIPLPKPSLAIELAEAASARTGTITVKFDAPARTAGAGTLTIALDPLAKGATDPAVGKTLPFTVAPGDTALPPMTFATGTTAGTIAIAVELGGAAERKTVAIPAMPVVLSAAAATRGAGSIEIRLAGFDNTRTAGRVVYTFYDTSGNALPAIAVDNTAEFANYFAGSDAGGAFLLRAVFPVTGDGSRITEFAAEMRNSSGTAVTGRVKF